MRGIIAARLSRKQAHGQDGLGLDTQDAESRKSADREGIDIVATVADTVSGTKAPIDRKNLSQWVTDPARLAEYDAIVALKMDRLSRGSQQDFTAIKAWADANHKTLIIADGPWYPARPGTADAILWTVLEDQAHKEWLSIRERIMRAKRRILADGGLCGKVPAFYVITGEKYAKSLRLVVGGAAIVAECHRMIQEDKSTIDAVARYLAGVTGNPWHGRTTGALLRSRTYCGTHVMHLEGETYEIECDAAIDAATWERTRRELDSRLTRTDVNGRRQSERSGGGRGRHAPRADGPAMLSKALTCPACGSPMNRSGEGGSVYRCSGSAKGTGVRKGCGNNVPLPVADVLVASVVAEWDAPVTRLVAVVPDDLENEIAKTLGSLRKLDVEADDFVARATDLKIRLASLREAQADAESNSGGYETVTEDFTYADVWATLESSQRASWLRQMGVKVFAAKTSTGACEALWERLEGQSVLRSAGGVSVLVTSGAA